jgi:hypothetical protein
LEMISLTERAEESLKHVTINPCLCLAYIHRHVYPVRTEVAGMAPYGPARGRPVHAYTPGAQPSPCIPLSR